MEDPPGSSKASTPDMMPCHLDSGSWPYSSKTASNRRIDIHFRGIDFFDATSKEANLTL